MSVVRGKLLSAPLNHVTMPGLTLSGRKVLYIRFGKGRYVGTWLLAHSSGLSSESKDINSLKHEKY